MRAFTSSSNLRSSRNLSDYLRLGQLRSAYLVTRLLGSRGPRQAQDAAALSTQRAPPPVRWKGAHESARRPDAVTPLRCVGNRSNARCSAARDSPRALHLRGAQRRPPAFSREHVSDPAGAGDRCGHSSLRSIKSAVPRSGRFLSKIGSTSRASSISFLTQRHPVDARNHPSVGLPTPARERTLARIASVSGT
jgi:hypothetical protein